jgi:hypothetical protein
LHLIAQELPGNFLNLSRSTYFLDSNFQEVKLSILNQYKKVEKELLNKFRSAGENNDIEQMQLTAETLSRYQNYQLCVDAYVEEALRQIDVDETIFEQITSLIDGKSSQISKVFNSPEQVLGKLIQSCYDNRLGEYIHHKLDPVKRKNLELYLSECQKLYEKTSTLSAALSKHRPGSGKGTLSTTTNLDFYLTRT